MADYGNVNRISAPVITSVTIHPVNDEPPMITNTSSEMMFTEEGDPINIVDGGVTIVDNDNCLNHTTVAQLVVRLENPVDGEDQLIVGGQVYENFTTTFSCDTGVNGSNCYEDFLRSIEYSNINLEPTSYTQERVVSIEVCTTVTNYISTHYVM